MVKAKPLGGRILNWPLVFFAPFVIICGFVIFHRLFFGIGAVADLNGGYPWGLWIAFDLLIGTGFACGGWALAWTVYVFNRGEYHPLVRPALLASLFGYSLGGLSIVMDMGRWWNTPYIYLPGYFNTNSVLFETAACMTVYVLVLAAEFAPALFERLGWKVPLKRLNGIMFAIIALGALLPTMHQSSMGSLFISAGHKVHPLWQSYELLPLFSLLTAFIMGFSIVVFEGSLVQAGLRGKGKSETPLFYKLTFIIDIFLVSFISMRFAELVVRNKVSYLAQFDQYALMFWAEIALMIFPLLVFHWDRLRKDARFLFLGALSMLIGAGLWRLDLSLLAFNPGEGFQYFPKTEEVLLSVGFIAIEISAYLLIVRLLPVLPALERIHHAFTTKNKIRGNS
ncbi:Ni/Fe-hydrogenase cytochrome b subunit [Photobacterium sagamiensis]|uniref:Ni/Fe-hydrogenase cytochrome b subunit n=1 Tax=Photobacterium sagamiensis TaxID=2910241 RepID=UPI003D12AB66